MGKEGRETASLKKELLRVSPICIIYIIINENFIFRVFWFSGSPSFPLNHETCQRSDLKVDDKCPQISQHPHDLNR